MGGWMGIGGSDVEEPVAGIKKKSQGLILRDRQWKSRRSSP